MSTYFTFQHPFISLPSFLPSFRPFFPIRPSPTTCPSSPTHPPMHPRKPESLWPLNNSSVTSVLNDLYFLTVTFSGDANSSLLTCLSIFLGGAVIYLVSAYKYSTKNISTTLLPLPFSRIVSSSPPLRNKQTNRQTNKSLGRIK